MNINLTADVIIDFYNPHTGEVTAHKELHNYIETAWVDRILNFLTQRKAGTDGTAGSVVQNTIDADRLSHVIIGDATSGTLDSAASFGTNRYQKAFDKITAPSSSGSVRSVSMTSDIAANQGNFTWNCLGLMNGNPSAASGTDIVAAVFDTGRNTAVFTKASGSAAKVQWDINWTVNDVADP